MQYVLLKDVTDRLLALIASYSCHSAGVIARVPRTISTFCVHTIGTWILLSVIHNALASSSLIPCIIAIDYYLFALST